MCRLGMFFALHYTFPLLNKIPQIFKLPSLWFQSLLRTVSSTRTPMSGLLLPMPLLYVT